MSLGYLSTFLRIKKMNFFPNQIQVNKFLACVGDVFYMTYNMDGHARKTTC